MKKFLLSLQLLTIIPIRIKGEVLESDIAGAAPYFPVTGFLQGLFLTAVSAVMLKLVSPAICAALIIAAYLIINGAFHQDGLSDTFDALSVKSTGNGEEDRRKRLAVMRDGTSGPIGITAIAVFLLLKFSLLTEVLKMRSPHGLNLVIILLPMISAWSMTMMMPGARSARSDGLGKIFLGKVSAMEVVLACELLAILTIVAGAAALPFNILRFAIFYPCAIAASLLAGYALRALFTARFGGLTGDNLGCIHEISEVMTLLAAHIFFRGL